MSVSGSEQISQQKEGNPLSKKELKTNAMRILDRSKIPYEYRTYAVSYTHLRAHET